MYQGNSGLSVATYRSEVVLLDAAVHIAGEMFHQIFKRRPGMVDPRYYTPEFMLIDAVPTIEKLSKKHNFTATRFIPLGIGTLGKRVHRKSALVFEL